MAKPVQGQDDPTNYVYKFLYNSTNSTDIEMAGSTDSPKTYIYRNTSDTSFISRINFVLVDGSMKYGSFGGLPALTNGIRLVATATDGSTEILDFYDGQAIKTNEDFTALAGVDAIVEPTSGDDYLPVRWTIAKASSGENMRLEPGMALEVVIQDDISGVTKLRAMVQGWIK